MAAIQAAYATHKHILKRNRRHAPMPTQAERACRRHEFSAINNIAVKPKSVIIIRL